MRTYNEVRGFEFAAVRSKFFDEILAPAQGVVRHRGEGWNAYSWTTRYGLYVTCPPSLNLRTQRALLRGICYGGREILRGRRNMRLVKQDRTCATYE